MEAQVRQMVADLVASYTAKNEVRQPVELEKPNGNLGIFKDMESAIAAAREAQARLVGLPLEVRRNIVASMREAAETHAQEFAERAVEESGRGNKADKILKNLLAARKTPGVEDVETVAYSDEHGLTVLERAPYGVIGSIIPVTNPTATVVNNGIGMVSGGNSVVFNPHPGAKQVSCHTIQILNEAIERAGGPANVLVSIAEPTIESANIMMKHPLIALLVVTGGPAVVRAAMGSGKKVIAAGPGNPPCVVDETAHIQKAARDIVAGASFDNNIVCICEKEVLVVESVADHLVSEMQKCGAYLLSPKDAQKLIDIVIEVPGGPGKEGIIRKEYVGKSPQELGRLAAVTVPEATRLLICEVDAGNPLVWTEQLMPLLPIVRMANVNQCIDLAVQCEHGFKHSAMMHSMDVEHLTKMARAMNCSVFVKNGPCYAGLGQGGAGFTSLTIASPTGEGLTRARTFTRERRCTLVDYFRII
jgi:acyl-CoA reductase-like NAD-dependent aldehyde dehydrogenase